MKKLNVEVEVKKLSEAVATSENENATEEEIAAALIVVNDFYKKLLIPYTKLKTQLETLNANKQMELELVYSNPEGDGIGILTDEITYTSVDMVGIHKDAQPQVTATYSDKIYEQIFTPNARASKKDVIRLAREGVLPNASKRVKDVTYYQTKMFDWKEPKNSDK